MEIITRIIMIAVAGIAVRLLFSFMYKKNDEEQNENQEGNRVIMRFPKIVFWLGCIGNLFWGMFMVFLFSDPTMELWCFIVDGLFLLLGCYIILLALGWRIELFRDKDYFIYRSTFFKKYIVNYSDCIGWRYVNGNEIEIKTAKRKFSIAYFASNYDVLVYMLRKNKVPKMRDA